MIYSPEIANPTSAVASAQVRAQVGTSSGKVSGEAEEKR